MRSTTTALLAAAVLALGANGAQAAVCQAQPGQGAIDQYCEIIPSGAGDRPTRPRDEPAAAGSGSAATGEQAAQGATGAEPRGPAVPPAVQRALREAGSDGTILRGLAATSPAPSGAGDAAARSGAGTRDARAARELVAARGDVAPGGASQGTLEALFSDPFGDPVGGAWVAWGALAVATLALAAAWRRRTRWS